MAASALALAVPFAVSCGDEPASGKNKSSGSGDGGESAATGSTGDDVVSATGSGGATASSTGAGASGGEGGSPPQVYGFPADWIDGTNCSSEPDFQVHAYADDTFILRQSLCTHFEAPFLYLLFGEDKVLLEDTGTGDADSYGAVKSVIDQWLLDNGKSSIELVAAHSHGHVDHTGGDGQFQGKPGVSFVSASVDSQQDAFTIDSWPADAGSIDLGGRVIDVLAIPGHQGAHVALYDSRHELLLTGDTLYPGRLYISDWQSYKMSIQRMVDFVDAGHPVSWVLGTHIEMTTTPMDDYPFQAGSHPNEHALELGYPVLVELNDAVQAMGNNPQYQAHDDFIIYP